MTECLSAFEARHLDRLIHRFGDLTCNSCCSGVVVFVVVSLWYDRGFECVGGT